MSNSVGDYQERRHTRRTNAAALNVEIAFQHGDRIETKSGGTRVQFVSIEGDCKRLSSRIVPNKRKGLAPRNDARVI
jgi:hypothetical protein